MNPVDTLRIVLERQAAMRREARLDSLARSVRTRHHGGFSAVSSPDGSRIDGDPLGVRRFLDR